VLADCFEKHIFSYPETTSDLLNLSEIRNELKQLAQAPAYNAISESVFAPEQIEILRKRFDAFVTPALNILLREPRPYQKLVSQYLVALKDLNNKVTDNVRDTKTYRDSILFAFRRTTEKDLTNVRSVEADFESRIQISDYDNVFFLNIFQQGLLRAWAQLSTVVGKILEERPDVIAKAMVPVLDRIVFNESKPYLFKLNTYLQTLIYDGEKLRVNDTSREQMCNLILAAFSSPDADKLLAKTLSTLLKDQKKDDKIELSRAKIAFAAKTARAEYIDSLYSRIVDDMRKNWRFKNLTDAQIVYLDARENNESLREEYDDQLKKICDERLGEAKIGLSNQLGITAEEL
jgi:hypothetical protein